MDLEVDGIVLVDVRVVVTVPCDLVVCDVGFVFVDAVESRR